MTARTQHDLCSILEMFSSQVLRNLCTHHICSVLLNRRTHAGQSLYRRSYWPLVATASMRLLATEECGNSQSEPKPGVSSFGFYQGLAADETRDPSRDDGTDWKMPCVLNTDIQAGVAKTYTFWHGHDGVDGTRRYLRRVRLRLDGSGRLTKIHWDPCPGGLESIKGRDDGACPSSPRCPCGFPRAWCARVSSPSRPAP